MDEAHLLLDRVTVRGRDRPMLAGLSLTLPRGRTLALLGPEGAGKTAALLTLAGFLRQSLGRVILGGREITTAAPERRDIGMVFQEDSVFPHLSVTDNVAFGLKMRGRPRADRRAAAARTLEALGIGLLAERHAARLDAAERRLVALARAVACRPALLLVDEPASSAEARAREALRGALRAAVRLGQTTAILATSDPAAAFGLSDTVALLRDGALEQIGAPSDLFERPASRFAAQFTGPCNLLPATLLGHDAAGAVVEIADGTARTTAWPGLPPGRVLACLRPHHLRLDPAGPLRGEVVQIDYQGAATRVTLRTPAGSVAADLMRVDPSLGIGSTVRLGWDPRDAWLLPGDG